MARLKNLSKASDEASLLPVLSNASDSVHTVLGNESTIEHPIPEPHSSDMPPPPSSRTPPPASASVLGANLLNAARMDRKHSDDTSGTTGPRNRKGKLRRRTLIPESSRTNLATRGDIYEIELSPVKNNYALPERVNKKPLVVVRKKTNADGELSAGLPGVTTRPTETATAEPAHSAPRPTENRQVAKEMKPSKKRKSALVDEEEQSVELPRRRKRDTRKSLSSVTPQEPGSSRQSSSAVEESNGQTNTEENEYDTSPDGQTAAVVQRTASIETVFKFLDIEERGGSCSTKFGKLLLRQCNTSCAKFEDETISTDTAVKDAAEIQEALKSTGGMVSEKRQYKFKSDAYSFVFHSLVTYLRALHGWLLKTHESVTDSLEALRVVAPLMTAILMFKDTIAQWNVTIPQRYKGDRLIKDVDSHLIAPLRQVEKAFSARLSQLEELERRRAHGEEMRRKTEEQNEAEGARIEAIEATQERKRRWQRLHIVRMQCEPNIYRRRKLFHTNFEDLVERDANGVVFERLPLFKARSAPPHSRISEIADETEWTEKEETAVLEGLQYCAGPCVYEKIFKTYCDPRSPHPRAGDLRNRSVAEIISKARWICSAMMVLCQETGEPVPKWVTKIPVLP